MVGDDIDFSISQFGDAWRLLCGGSPGHVKWARKLADAAKARGVGFDDAGNAVKFD